MDDHNVYLRPPVWLPIIVVLIAGGSYIAGKHIEIKPMNTVTISVQGEGKVMAQPDVAMLTFGVQVARQRTADGAMKMLAENMTKVFDAVKVTGIEEKDITTQYLSLTPAYDWQEGTRIDRGFEASQTLMVKVRDLEKITAVLDAAVKSGSNQVGSVSFTIDDPAELQAEARKEAIADAQAKAVKLAEDLDVTLGKMSAFWEEFGGGPIPYMERSMAVDGMGGGGMVAPPVPAGEQEVVVRVNLTYKVR